MMIDHRTAKPSYKSRQKLYGPFVYQLGSEVFTLQKRGQHPHGLPFAG